MSDDKGTIASAVDAASKIADVVADDSESTLVDALSRIADSFDRLVALAEDLADSIELPHGKEE